MCHPSKNDSAVIGRSSNRAASRVGWAARPSDLVATWAAEFHTVVLEALRKQPVPSIALIIGGYPEVGQAKLHEAEFMLQMITNRQWQSSTSHARRRRHARCLS